jgi:hypothetical protein
MVATLLEKPEQSNGINTSNALNKVHFVTHVELLYVS